ncbi:chloride channel protein [bacterium]|nr:chloride channel protein [bacterium]
MSMTVLANGLRRVNSRLRRTEHLYMVIVAVAVGLLAGLCAVGFREMIHLVQGVAWKESKYTLDHIRDLPVWWKLVVPTVGMLIVGLIVQFFASEAKGHGVPEVMEAVILRNSRIRPRVVIGKMIASALCIGTGGSVGREGPIVQVGASLGSTAGQWLGLGERRMRTLVGCGAGAGIAAAFNAPVAGALFAVEIILGDFAVTQFSPIVLASVSATVVSRHFHGDFPAFPVPKYSLETPWELFGYGALGILAGLGALAFIRILYWSEDSFEKIKVPLAVKTTVGGLLVGLIAIRFPQVLGVGYEAIDDALGGNTAWTMLLMLALVKIVGVSITIGSGGSGGIFAPSLFIGAMLGGAIGTVMGVIAPGAVASPGAYALVGMGAMVAAATHAPITAILIIFELTNDYKIILPLMISCIIATLLSSQLQKASIYTLKLLRRGIDVTEEPSANLLKNVKTERAMRKAEAKVKPSDPLTAVIGKFIDHPGDSIFVVGEEDRFLGAITIDEIRPIMSDPSSFEHLIIAEDLMVSGSLPVISPDDSLDSVMQAMGDYRYEAPVVKDGKLRGAIRPDDVIRQYNEALFKRETAPTMAAAITRQSTMHPIPGVEDLGLAEVPVPDSFLNKSLRDLDVRVRFGVTIVLIRMQADPSSTEPAPTIAAMPNHVFRPGEALIAVGSSEGLKSLEVG